jgi:ribosomal protein S28E/S33
MIRQTNSKEVLGNIVGVSEHCGNALTYKVLTADTGHVIYRSILHPVNNDDVNLRASMFVGEPGSQTPITKLLNQK